jgi:hypothetical protein
MLSSAKRPARDFLGIPMLMLLASATPLPAATIGHNVASDNEEDPLKRLEEARLGCEQLSQF